jgi:hypothetical protein
MIVRGAGVPDPEVMLPSIAFNPPPCILLSVESEGAKEIRYGHWLTESIGGRFAFAASWSVGSTPARCAKVEYQSQM